MRQHAAERRRLRGVRRALTPQVRRAAERHIVATLRRLGLVARGRHVAVYLAIDGEVDLAALLQAARRIGTTLYAPRLADRRRRIMRFLPLSADARCTRNHLGIAEPVARSAAALAPRRLDVVIAPLVGFDARGCRLGMGGGYYDRALRHRAVNGIWRRPRIVGVAFACQETDRLTAAPWDVPLDLIVTERGVLRPRRPLWLDATRDRGPT